MTDASAHSTVPVYSTLLNTKNTTNLGALSMESGLRPAAVQLENRPRWFGLRLLDFPQGDQAREIAGAPTTIGRSLTNTLAYAERTESIALLEEPETLDEELV